MKKKLWLKCLLSAGLIATALSGCGARQDMPDPEKTLVRVWGPLLETEEAQITIDNRGETAAPGELVLTVSPESTKILDAKNGLPVPLSDLKKEEAVFAYITNTSALSEPPIGNAEAILCRLPSDLRVPDYLRAEALERQSDDSYLLTSDSGMEYLIPADCEIIPYLTKNRVVLSDMKKGSVCLLWSDEKRAAQKILLFAD